MSDALVIQAYCLQKMSDLQKNCFFIGFWHFPPFLWIASVALRSFALLSWVTWAICSCHSLQKCVPEQFAQAAHAKREEEQFIERWKTVKNKWRKHFWGANCFFFKQFAQIRSKSLTLLFFKEHQEQIAHNPSVVKSAMSILLFCKE